MADLLVNAALFAALGYVTGQPFLAAASFVALTLVLAVDFNVTELYREAHEIPNPQPPATGGTAERILAVALCGTFSPRSTVLCALSQRGAFTGAELRRRSP